MSSQSTHGSGGGQPEKGRRLRRPHAATEQRLRNGEFDSNDNIEMKSKLSADAPVFIPKSASALQNDSQNDQFYQDFQRLVSIRPSHLTGVTTAGTATKESPADMFKNAVFELTSNPGPMEEYLKPITDSLKRGVTDVDIINEIIETLFQQSIAESNFRFTGAKICKYLSNELKSHHVFSNFRGMFLNRCKQDFDRREELLKSDIERLCGLSMFFGELFLVLEIVVDGKLTRIGIIRKSIEDLVNTLLSQLDDITVKCSTQLLKLTGTALMETTDLQGNFDEIFKKIKSLEKHPSLNKTSHCLINSVLSRYEYNFGVGQQVSPQKPVTQTAPYNPHFQLNEPVFYNSLGQPISREEAGFSQDESSEFEGLNREEQEAFLQWEAENLMNQQQWSDQGGDNYDRWQDNYINEQQFSDYAGNGFIQQPWSSDVPEYARWSANQDQNYGFNQGDYGSDANSEMDDEMAAYFEMFLSDSGQQK